MAVSAFYGACDVVLSPSAASDAALAAIGMPRRAGAALGPRRGHVAFRPVAARARAAAGARSTSCTPGASPARRAPSCSSRPSCWPASADPRLHLVLAGGGPEQERVARAPRRARDASSAGCEGDGARARLCERRHLPVPERYGHLRAGHPRGPGERAARDRRRPGRAAVADRGSRRAACSASPRPSTLAARCSSSPAPRCCAQHLAARGAAPARGADLGAHAGAPGAAAMTRVLGDAERAIGRQRSATCR